MPKYALQSGLPTRVELRTIAQTQGPNLAIVSGFPKKRKCDGVTMLPRATDKAKRVEDRRTGVWN
jgi:hypothetical protein